MGPESTQPFAGRRKVTVDSDGYIQKEMAKWEVINYTRILNDPANKELAQFFPKQLVLQHSDGREIDLRQLSPDSEFYQELLSSPDSSEYTVKMTNAAPDGGVLDIKLGDIISSTADKIHGKTSVARGLKRVWHILKQNTNKDGVTIQNHSKGVAREIDELQRASQFLALLKERTGYGQLQGSERKNTAAKLLARLQDLKSAVEKSSIGFVGSSILIHVFDGEVSITLIDVENNVLPDDPGVTKESIEKKKASFIRGLTNLQEHLGTEIQRDDDSEQPEASQLAAQEDTGNEEPAETDRNEAPVSQEDILEQVMAGILEEALAEEELAVQLARGEFAGFDAAIQRYSGRHPEYSAITEAIHGLIRQLEARDENASGQPVTDQGETPPGVENRIEAFLNDYGAANPQAQSLVERLLILIEPGSSTVNQLLEVSEEVFRQTGERNRQIRLAKESGFYGHTIKPDVAADYLHAVVFDGTGRVVGLREGWEELDNIDKLRLKHSIIKPLSRTNSPYEREAPKTETESLIEFASSLRDKAGIPEIDSLYQEIKSLWFDGGVSKENVKALLLKASEVLNEYPLLQRKADALLSHVEKDSVISRQHDNLFGRVFESELGRKIISDIPESFVQTSIEYGSYLFDSFEEYISEKFAGDAESQNEFVQETMQELASKIKGHARPWYSRVSALNEFITEPTLDNFRNMLTRIEDGYGVISLSHITPVIANFDKLGFHQSSWKKASVGFYKDFVLAYRGFSTEIAGSGDGYSVVVDPAKTTHRDYGIGLRYQPRNAQFSDFLRTRNVVEERVLDQDKLTAFEKNALDSGMPVGLGTSGITTIVDYLYKHIAAEKGSFSVEQAYLNTLFYFLFDGSHSVVDSLVVYRALQLPEEQRNEFFERTKFSYNDIIDIANDVSEALGASIERALEESFIQTLKYYEENAYSAQKHFADVAEWGLQLGFIPVDAVLSQDINNTSEIDRTNLTSNKLLERSDVAAQVLTISQSEVDTLLASQDKNAANLQAYQKVATVDDPGLRRYAINLLESGKLSNFLEINGEYYAFARKKFGYKKPDFEYRLTPDGDGRYRVSFRSEDFAELTGRSAYAEFQDLQVFYHNGEPLSFHDSLEAIYYSPVETRYDSQVIIQLGETESEENAARYLQDKHSGIRNFSRRLKRVNGQLVDADTGKELTDSERAQLLGRNGRIIVVGHGEMLDDAFAVSGLTSQQLAEMISDQVVEEGDAVTRISLVACDCEESPSATENYGRALLTELSADGVHVDSLTARTSRVQVTPDGRKLTESNNSWLSKEGTNKLILEWQGDEIVNNSNDQSGNPADVPEGSSGPLGGSESQNSKEDTEQLEQSPYLLTGYTSPDKKENLIGFYASGDYVDEHSEQVTLEQIAALSRLMSKFFSIEFGEQVLQGLNDKNSEFIEETSLNDLDELGFLNLTGDNIVLPQPLRVLIVLDTQDNIDQEGYVGLAKRLKGTTEDLFGSNDYLTVIHVNPEKMSYSDSGVSYATELFTRVTEALYLQLGEVDNLDDEQLTLDIENTIRFDLDIPKFYPPNSDFKKELYPKRIGFEQELMNYQVVRHGEHSTRKYRGTALRTLGETMGLPNLKVMLDTSSSRGALIELVTAPLEYGSYESGSAFYKATELLKKILKKMIDENGEVTFSRLKEEYNSELVELLSDDLDAFNAYQLEEVEGEIFSKLGEEDINPDEFVIKPFGDNKFKSDTRIQTNISFEYGRLGNPLSGLDQFSDKRLSLRHAQIEASRWAYELTDTPSDHLKSFLTHLIFAELHYRDLKPGKDFDKTKLLSQLRSTPVDAVLSILSDNDIEILNSVGSDALKKQFEIALNNFAQNDKGIADYRNAYNTTGLEARTKSALEDAIELRLNTVGSFCQKVHLPLYSLVKEKGN